MKIEINRAVLVDDVEYCECEIEKLRQAIMEYEDRIALNVSRINEIDSMLDSHREAKYDEWRDLQCE